MTENITLTKSMLVNLIDSALITASTPNPEPYHPVETQVSRETLRDWVWSILHPNPAPPNFGPNPQPWLTAVLVRTVIDQAVSQTRLAETIYSGEQSKRATEGAISYIREVADDYCGTPPSPHRPHWPFPSPWPININSIPRTPLDRFVAGAELWKAADATSNGPLKEAFSAAADKIFESGLGNMKNM